MLFSVVIPTYRRNFLLSECLKCLAPEKQTISIDNYEVIVTDDDSEAKEMIESDFPWVRWVKGPGKGPAANRNNGAKNANGSWLVFTDDDCLPDKNWLRSFFNTIKKDPQPLAIEGKVSADRTQIRYNESSPLNQNGGCFWSCNIAIKRGVFFQFGGFDERFPFACMEDVALRELLKAEKIPILFDPFAEVVHPLKIESFSYVNKYTKIRHKSLLIFKDNYSFLASNITTKYFLYGALYKIYNAVRQFPKFGFRGIWIVPVQSAYDVMFAFRLLRT
jgi:GT2 family glycosyltransferase